MAQLVLEISIIMVVYTISYHLKWLKTMIYMIVKASIYKLRIILEISESQWIWAYVVSIKLCYWSF